MNTKNTRTEVQFQNIHKDLIDRCRKGDQKAQFQIYKTYYKAMYNISLRIVKNTMEAEDIMQESFLSAFEKIGTYSGTVSFGAWLRKIVQNRSLDHLSRQRKLSFEYIESIQIIENSHIENSYIREEQDSLMNKVMAKIKLLPEKYRNIISLYLFEGYDHNEIAEILSISSSTSRSQFSRAKQKLLSEFKGVRF